MKTAIALCAALALGACAHTAGPAPTPAEQAQIVLASGQLAADAAYNAAATAYLAQAPTMAPAAKATIKGILLKIYICHPDRGTGDQACAGYLKDTHDFVRDGNAAAAGQDTILIQNLITQAESAGLVVKPGA